MFQPNKQSGGASLREAARHNKIKSILYMKTRLLITAISAIIASSSLTAHADDTQLQNRLALQRQQQVPSTPTAMAVVTPKMPDACKRLCADYQRKGFPTVACVERMTR